MVRRHTAPPLFAAASRHRCPQTRYANVLRSRLGICSALAAAPPLACVDTPTHPQHLVVQAEPEPEPELDDEEEEEEEGEMAEMPAFDRKKGKLGRGRVIVQESVAPGTGTQGAPAIRVEKSDSDIAVIMAAFKQKPLFSKLDPGQLSEVAMIMQRESFAPGQPLMTEGENGDMFFIVSDGTCDVAMAGRHLRELPAGEAFGEIALIYNQPRTSTIVAKTQVEAFTLTRDAYRNSVVESIKRQRAAREEFLGRGAFYTVLCCFYTVFVLKTMGLTVPIFAKMRPNQRAKVADALQVARFEPNARIITQGDIGDLFYIIEVGSAVITEKDSDKRLVFDAGRFFGEIALIENVPRTAHIHAGEGGASCLTLDRAAYVPSGIMICC